MRVNSKIKTLDLSRNFIGRAANGAFTGAHALAQMLQQADSKLHTLDLSWNYISGKNAAALGGALHGNRTLTDLKLMQCAFAQAGGEGIGNALDTCILKRLDLSFNRLDHRAAFVIAMGMADNRSLRR